MQEQGKYKIGEYTFQTFHEYRDGQEDVRKIECINKELNIQDPEVAVRLYNDIRSGKIVFKTPIGDQFFAHLADIVADKSVDLLEDKAVVEEAEGKVKYQKILGVGFVILAVVSFAVFGIAELRDIVTTRQMQKLANQVEVPKEEDTVKKQKNSTEATGDGAAEATTPKEETPTQNLTVLPEYAERNVDGELVYQKNLFYLSNGLYITNTSMANLMKLLPKVPFLLDDSVSRSNHLDAYFKEIYKNRVLCEAHAITMDQYRQSIEDTLEDLIQAPISGQEFVKSLRDMTKYHLIDQQQVSRCSQRYRQIKNM